MALREAGEYLGDDGVIRVPRKSRWFIGGVQPRRLARASSSVRCEKTGLSGPEGLDRLCAVDAAAGPHWALLDKHHADATLEP